MDGLSKIHSGNILNNDWVEKGENGKRESEKRKGKG